MYCGHLKTNHKCPDYQAVLIFSLYDKAPFGLTKSVDCAGILITSFTVSTFKWYVNTLLESISLLTSALTVTH